MPAKIALKPLKRGDHVVSRYSKVKGKVVALNPFVVKTGSKRGLNAMITNPNFWKRRK